MARRYGDLVEVRPLRKGEVADERSVPFERPDRPDSEPPGSFLWRGRLYLVRSVVGHWRERRAWWTTAQAGAVHGEDPVTSERVAVGTRTGGSSLAAEREIWRVEASPGRCFGAGIYDLCREPDLAAGERQWRLVRVAD